MKIIKKKTDTNEKFECEVCNKVLATQRGLSVHKLWHNPKYAQKYKRMDVWNSQDEIVELYKNNSLSEISRKYNCSLSSIRAILVGKGIEIRKKEGQFQVGNTVGAGRFGSENPSWKGDDAKYHAIHDWVKKHKPQPEFCEICNKQPPTEIANKSGEYLRDINDYWWSCCSCHHKLDETITNIKHMKERLVRNLEV